MGLFAEVDSKVNLLAHNDSIDVSVIRLEVNSTASLYSEGECEGARTTLSAASTLKLVGFSFLEASELSRVCLLFGEVFLVLSSSLLNHFDLLFIVSDFLEEVLFDRDELFFELRTLVTFVFLLCRNNLGSQFLGHIEGLLSAEFSFENLEHNFFLSRLEVMIVKGRAQL